MTPSDYSEDYYQIYADLYEILNEIVQERIKNLPEEEQLAVVDMLSETFRFRYHGGDDESE